jgi:hypothetical protein
LTASQAGVTVIRFVDITTGDYGDPGIRVITADDPRAWNSISPGDRLTAVLAGFAPNSTVPLALYRGTDEFTDVGAVFEFYDTLPAATVGEQGWAYYEFTVPGLDPLEGLSWDYCIATVESLRLLYCQPYVDAVFNVAE